jgi:hypothetical protein
MDTGLAEIIKTYDEAVESAEKAWKESLFKAGQTYEQTIAQAAGEALIAAKELLRAAPK